MGPFPTTPLSPPAGAPRQLHFPPGLWFAAHAHAHAHEIRANPRPPKFASSLRAGRGRSRTGYKRSAILSACSFPRRAPREAGRRRSGCWRFLTGAIEGSSGPSRLRSAPPVLAFRLAFLAPGLAMSCNYVVTAQKPTAVNSCVTGNGLGGVGLSRDR